MHFTIGFENSINFKNRKLKLKKLKPYYIKCIFSYIYSYE